MEGSLKAFMENISIVFEVLAVSTIVAGAAASLWVAVVQLRRGAGTGVAYEHLRNLFARSVLLGLEILVAADLIRTVAVEPTLNNLYVLGILVLIRTFLSWSLDVELDGMWPWQKFRNKGQLPGPGPAGASATAATATTRDEG